MSDHNRHLFEQRPSDLLMRLEKLSPERIPLLTYLHNLEALDRVRPEAEYPVKRLLLPDDIQELVDKVVKEGSSKPSIELSAEPKLFLWENSEGYRYFSAFARDVRQAQYLILRKAYIEYEDAVMVAEVALIINRAPDRVLSTIAEGFIHVRE